jgi:hypothetical protein
MTTGAIVFMAASWSFVLGLTFWSYRRMLSSDKTKVTETTEAESNE